MNPARLTAGLSLKPAHFDEALACLDAGLWFEVHPENYAVAGGPRLAWLDAIRSRHPLSLHGVPLSLADRIEPVLVSEHLVWSAWRSNFLPDLLPFARMQAALLRVAGNIARTQDALGQRIAIENPSHYLHLQGHAGDEVDFFAGTRAPHRLRPAAGPEQCGCQRPKPRVLHPGLYRRLSRRPGMKKRPRSRSGLSPAPLRLPAAPG